MALVALITQMNQLKYFFDFRHKTFIKTVFFENIRRVSHDGKNCQICINCQKYNEKRNKISYLNYVFPELDSGTL